MGKIINGQRLFLIVMSAVFVCLTSSSLQAAGSWKSLTHSCPETPTSSLLLTNGQVLTVTGSGDCYLLTPDQHGHYWDGMWNQSASMLSQPTTINGAVLNSGKVLLVAGEFSAQTNLVQVYDPVQNTWAFTSETYTDSTGQHPLPGFEDCNVDLLNNGHVITTPDDSQVPITLEYDPTRICPGRFSPIYRFAPLGLGRFC